MEDERENIPVIYPAAPGPPPPPSDGRTRSFVQRRGPRSTARQLALHPRSLAAAARTKAMWRALATREQRVKQMASVCTRRPLHPAPLYARHRPHPTEPRAAGEERVQWGGACAPARSRGASGDKPALGRKSPVQPAGPAPALRLPRRAAPLVLGPAPCAHARLARASRRAARYVRSGRAPREKRSPPATAAMGRSGDRTRGGGAGAAGRSMPKSSPYGLTRTASTELGASRGGPLS